MVMAAALAALTLAAPPSPPFTRAATTSCLLRLPHAVAGLPPATAPPMLFVYALERDAISSWNPTTERRPRPHTQLGAWYGDEGTIFTFFASVADARASAKSLSGLYGG